MGRSVDGCEHVEGGGSLQLIKAPPEKLPPSLVRDLVGISLLEEVKDWLRSHRDDG